MHSNLRWTANFYSITCNFDDHRHMLKVTAVGQNALWLVALNMA